MKNINNILTSTRPLTNGNGYGVQPLNHLCSDINKG